VSQTLQDPLEAAIEQASRFVAREPATTPDLLDKQADSILDNERARAEIDLRKQEIQDRAANRALRDKYADRGISILGGLFCF
jgi:hypothetical protein